MATVRSGGDSARHQPSWLSDSRSALARSIQEGSTQEAPYYASRHLNRELRRHSQQEPKGVGLAAWSKDGAAERSELALEPLPLQGTPSTAGAERVAPSWWQRNFDGMRSVLFHPFSILLVAFPLGIISSWCAWDAQLTFWLNFLALIPLAKMLGDATEELDASLHSEVVSGLLNATFGNAVEMIITIQTLRAGLVEVVKATLLGSVLSNMLLVLGMSFFFGGILELGGRSSGESGRATPGESGAESSSLRQPLVQAAAAECEPSSARGGIRLVREKEQEFIVNSALVSVTMLLVSCLSFALPTVFSQAFGEKETVLSISRTTACIVGLSYFAYLFFQLITHRNMLANTEEQAEEDDEEGLTVGFSIGLLAITTVLVSISTECLVNVIQDVVSASGISECFIGIILLPIVGNACEHAAAVRFAIYDKPGLSISIAVGSSVQVALFVVPFAVIMGWAIGQPMTLDFGMINTTVLIICVLVVMSIVVDGRSNWLEGYMLCSAYALIAVMYWHVESFGDVNSSGEL